MKESPVSPSHAKHTENTRATDLQNPSAGAGREPQQGHGSREAEELAPTADLAHCFHRYYRKYLPYRNKLKKKLHIPVFYYAKTQYKFQKWAVNTSSTRSQLLISVERLQVCSLSWLTSKTSSSNILVPNTIMPLTSMMGWSLRSKNLVIFFLQSNIKVTFFFCTLMATLCHLEEHSPQMC